MAFDALLLANYGEQIPYRAVSMRQHAGNIIFDRLTACCLASANPHLPGLVFLGGYLSAVEGASTWDSQALMAAASFGAFSAPGATASLPSADGPEPELLLDPEEELEGVP